MAKRMVARRKFGYHSDISVSTPKELVSTERDFSPMATQDNGVQRFSFATKTTV
jgi:hypothetical protein